MSDSNDCMGDRPVDDSSDWLGPVANLEMNTHARILETKKLRVIAPVSCGTNKLLPPMNKCQSFKMPARAQSGSECTRWLQLFALR